MTTKRLGTNEHGYRPMRELRTVSRGRRDAVVFDLSVAYKLVISVIIPTAAVFLRSWVDLLLGLVATGFVLALEIMNSAVEALCDLVETRHNEKIRVIKDMAAAAAGIAIAVWRVVAGFETEEMVCAWLTNSP